MDQAQLIGIAIGIGGATLLALIGSVARLPLNTLPVEIHLPKALCEGMIPVTIEGLPTYVKNITNSATVMLEQLKNSTGIDTKKIAKRPPSSADTGLPKELE